MPQSEPQSSGFSLGRRWLTTFNLIVATTAVLALVVMFNYLAAGHFRRFPWADATSFKLSPQTLRVLNSLTNDVKITVFYQRQADVYAMICGLLAEYQNANPSHVRFVVLDYDKSPVEAQDLLTRLHLGSNQKDFVAFESNGRHKICTDNKLSNYDFNDLLRGREVRRTAFLGELYFTSAIMAVSHPADQRAYFLTGHGERDPGDPSGKGAVPDGSGYAKLAAILKDELSCDWNTLSLNQTDSIPADCSLLIVASGRQPTGHVSSNELFQIQTFLHANGRLLALLNTPEGLEPLLNNWDVVLSPMHVIDSDKRVRTGDGEFLACPALDPASSSIHPIMKPLVREGLSIQMAKPHPIFAFKSTKNPGDPTLTPVAVTSPNGIQWPGEPAFTKTNGAALPPFSYTLIAAIEQGVINGHDGTRIVVAGDADFLDNQMIDDAANHYFAGQTLDWLLQRQQALVGGIGPRPIHEYHLYLTQSQTMQLRWLFLAGMPGSVLFLGALVWLRRRS
jgi:hypothetical protein